MKIDKDIITIEPKEILDDKTVLVCLGVKEVHVKYVDNTFSTAMAERFHRLERIGILIEYYIREDTYWHNSKESGTRFISPETPE